MITLTVFLNSSEWDKLRQAARTWPSEQLSSTETGRRLVLLGCAALEHMTKDEQTKVGTGFRSELALEPDSGWMRLQGASEGGRQHFSQAAGAPVAPRSRR